MPNTKILASLSEFLTSEELAAFRQHPVTAERPHPLTTLLRYEDGRSQHAVNTERALKQVSIADLNWIEKIKPRIVGPDLLDSASALSELRAYGALLEAGYQVKPVPTEERPTPDFTITDGSTTVLVEVHAKQFDETTEKEFQEHRKWVSEQPSPSGVTSYTHWVHPWGKPTPGKRGDSTTTNAISRICSIKKDEKQFVSGVPGILWMDFQDLYSLDMSMTAEQFRPVISSNEYLTSGALWHGLYGWKGAPVFNHCHYSHLDLPSQIIQMEHGGRFFQPTKLSAIVASFPTATILAESPIRGMQLSQNLRLRYMGLPWAGIQHTIAEWTSGHVVQTLRLHASLICGLIGIVPPSAYPSI
jgi:hypothetical protein